MSLQIDQSGKIEETATSSVLGASNLIKASVYISGREKRKLQERFRRIGKPRLFRNMVFSSLLYFLVKRLDGSLVVDIEYAGHTREIEYLVKLYLGKNANLTWKLIGKSSPAHDLAYKIKIGKIKPDTIITAENVINLITKKAGGYLKIGLSPTNRYSGPGSVRKSIPKKHKKSR